MTSVAERLRLTRFSSTLKSDSRYRPKKSLLALQVDEQVSRSAGMENGA